MCVSIQAEYILSICCELWFDKQYETQQLSSMESVL